MKKLLLLVVLFLVSVVTLYADAQRLFVIERSKNANIVCYDATVIDGKINKKEPIDAYWLLYAEKNGAREELSAFDKKAYGYKAAYNENNKNFDFVLKAVKEKPMTVNMYNNKAKAIIKINDIDCFLNKVYIESKDGAFGIPKVSYYELFGKEVVSGKAQKQRIDVK